MKIIRLSALAAALAVPTAALAHPGAHHVGLLAGLAHPFTGIDHLLAMLAVGLWAAQIGGRARLAVPLAFIVMMAAGGMIGLSGITFGLVETAVAASVAALGLAVLAGIRLPVSAASLLVGAAALMHGIAHGTELPAMASPGTYVLGFVVATSLIHAAGLGLGMARSGRIGQVIVRTAGAGVALAGLLLLGA